MKRQVYKISVRELIEFILRTGDIDQRRQGKIKEKDAMLAGSRMHRKIQKGMGSDYVAEVSLKYVKEKEAYDLQIEGRADGIIHMSDGIMIDEIKSVYRDLLYIEEPELLHLAQAKCYAAMYLKNEIQNNIWVQITYVQLETEKIKQFKEQLNKEELINWFDEIVDRYIIWTDWNYEWVKRRNHTIKNLVFPYEYRTGQKELAVDVYRSILRNKRLFIQAPTGVGKTLSVLFPAIKAMGETLTDKLFYLTAKTIGAKAAYDAMKLFWEQEIQVNSVFISAKEKICILEEMECDPEHCEYAKGHYDRVNEAVLDFLNHEVCGDRETILFYANKHKVCPFELSLDIATWTDLVVGDFNYVFDPYVRLKRFFSEGTKENYVFLIDEAHNLVERGREMFSASLCKEKFLEMKRKIKPHSKKIEKQLERCNSFLLEKKRECQEYEVIDDIGKFLLDLLRTSTLIQEYLEEHPGQDITEELKNFYFDIIRFLDASSRYNDRYITYTYYEDGDFYIKIYCVDPSGDLRMCLDQGRASVFFSATMLPVNYYKELLSGEKEDYAIYARTPFLQENRLLLIGTDVSSRYSLRSEKIYDKIAKYIFEIIKMKQGNYMVFFPSYAFMNTVKAHFLKNDLIVGKIQCVFQENAMSEQKKEEFLNYFSNEKDNSVIGFCVLGGVFSEGIDLKEERLIGSIIIGTGLPMICAEREVLKGFYNKNQKDGFLYAYLYPGMNKVQQAAGRVIRTEKDRGVIALLDERFLTASYQNTFPLEWNDYKTCRIDTADLHLQDYWERMELEKIKNNEQIQQQSGTGEPDHGMQ